MHFLDTSYHFQDKAARQLYFGISINTIRRLFVPDLDFYDMSFIYSALSMILNY